MQILKIVNQGIDRRRRADEPTTDDYEQQKQTHKTIVEAFLAARRHKTIVIWGLRNGSPYWLTDSHPLLFDEDLNKKVAYDGVQEALSGL